MNIRLRSAPPPLVTGSLRVDLLPPRERERRAQLTLLRRWLVALVAAIGVLAVLIGGACLLQAAAAQRLAEETSRSSSLDAELATYQDVTRALSERSALQKYRSDASANELDWPALWKSLNRGLASGATIVDCALVPGAAPTGADPSTQVGVSGTLTVASADPSALYLTVQRLRTVSGILAADAGDVTLSDTERRYTVVVLVAADQTFYTDRYVVKGR
ncbi:hypothetical protein [Propionicicella superfundia]|uniref:hypothetical protein n=1 Tax=Propionicicella superfundia TaxID=348582 RepID=UPI00042A489E|nr:hypothetical protein [Propionicicella superfundia]